MQLAAYRSIVPLGLRRAIYWSFIALFACIAPLLALYSMGYRYHWGKHRLERTGLLVVTGTPSDAIVRVDGRVRASRLPARIGGLTENEYAVRIEREGYHARAQRVTVASGRTTSLRDVTLFRDALPELLASGVIRNATVSANGAWLAYVHVASAFDEVWLLDLRTGDRTLAVRLPNSGRAGEARGPTLAWSPRNAALLIATDDRVHLLIRTELRTAPVALSPAFASAPERIEWELGSATALVASVRGMLIRYHVATERVTPLGIRAPAPPFGIQGDTHYAVDTRGAITAQRIGSDARTVLARLPAGVAARALATVDGATLAVTTTAGTTVYIPLPSGTAVAIPGTIRAVTRTPDGLRRTFWTTEDRELWVADGDGSPQLLVRRATPITVVVAHRDGHTITVASATDLTAYDVRDPAGAVATPLATFDAITAVAGNLEGTMLSIIGQRDAVEGLWSLRLR